MDPEHKKQLKKAYKDTKKTLGKIFDGAVEAVDKGVEKWQAYESPAEERLRRQAQAQKAQKAQKAAADIPPKKNPPRRFSL